MDRYTLHVGDCREVLRGMDAGSVHCCVTSPPYWGLRDYGHAGQIGLEKTPEAYVAEMVAVFREVRRVLRDDGTLWLNLGDSYAGPRGNNRSGFDNPKDDAGRALVLDIPVWGQAKQLVGIPWRVAFALQADGWYLRQDIIWHKPNPMPESVTDRCTKSHEYIFLLSKSARYWYDAEAIKEPIAQSTADDHRSNDDGHRRERGFPGQPSNGGTRLGSGQTRNRRDVWTVATQPYAGAHFATYPPALVTPCILAGCPATVCATCGAGYERVIERTGGPPNNRFRDGLAGDCKTAHTEGTVAGSALSRLYAEHGYPQIRTLGHRPSCACPGRDGDAPGSDCADADNYPTAHGIVLDPFNGSGTTGLVAMQHNRRYIGIELNPEYAELTRQRLAAEAAQPQLEL